MRSRFRLRDLKDYPSAIAGAAIILMLFLVAIVTLIALPYERAVALWRGGEGVWLDNPRNARPAWYNVLPWVDLPRTIVLDSREGGAEKTREAGEDITEIVMDFTFDYGWESFPQEVTLNLFGTYEENVPYVDLTWHTPDGRRIALGNQPAGTEEVVRLSQDNRLTRRLGDRPAEIGLFMDATAEEREVIAGEYRLEVEGYAFEPDSDIEAKLVVYGKVHGIAGTDHRRRDISIALLWGTPTALAFGLVAALGVGAATMIIAAIGVWFGGWVDGLIQRITEIYLILPLLPLLIMIGTFYSRSIWVMLGVIIIFSIFGASIKTYRSMFLQVRESPYIEAARAYGANGGRIIFRYMIPRILPVLIPNFVVAIPTFVFLEATLAALGLGDPVLPTWGKVLDDARTNGALYNGHYYWMIQPAVLLMLTGLGFAMLGFALDRIFNPRLREI